MDTESASRGIEPSISLLLMMPMVELAKRRIWDNQTRRSLRLVFDKSIPDQRGSTDSLSSKRVGKILRLTQIALLQYQSYLATSCCSLSRQ